jgi:hypothetical protein
MSYHLGPYPHSNYMFSKVNLMMANKYTETTCCSNNIILYYII